MRRGLSVVLVAVGGFVVLGGSSERQGDAAGGSVGVGGERPAVSRGVDRRVTSRRGNRQGRVLVLMYHRVGDVERYMVRSRKNFRGDLERLYRLGYRPVTLAEYTSNQMVLPRGASPVVLTFDDSDPTQFRMLADGRIDPGSMVGIWHEFSKSRPDFPVKGTFFVLPNGPFGQKRFAERKLALLREWGSEVASHTMTHRNMSKISDEEVRRELALSAQFVRRLGWEPVSFALPFGVSPRNRSLLKGGSWNGVQYGYENVVLAGSAPGYSPLSVSFDRQRIPRVWAYEGDRGIDYWLDRMKSGRVEAYVQP